MPFEIGDAIVVGKPVVAPRTETRLKVLDENGTQLRIFNVPYFLDDPWLQTALNQGNHKISIETDNLGLATANYVYQLEVKNKNGTFRQCKLMTASK